MRVLLDRLYRGSCWVAAGCLASICLLVVCQVFLNLVDRLSTIATGSAIGLTIPSYADFTGFLLAAASFLALAHTLREGGHIRVVLLLSKLPKKFLPAVEFWCAGLAFLISVYFTYYTALLAIESFTYNDLSPGMIAVPLWIPQSFMLFGLVVLCISLLDEIVRIIAGGRPSYAEDTAKLLDESAQPESLRPAE